MMYTANFFIRWVSLLSLLVAFSVNAQTVHISHCMAGCPVDSSNMAVDDSELIVRQLFVASINAANGLADWQAYRVLADSVGVASLLPRLWFEDSLVTRGNSLAENLDESPDFVQALSTDAEERSYQLNEITTLSDDEGRLVPMSSFAGTPYWTELNFLSNMAPLPYELRSGSWSRLDTAINELADRIGEVYVVSGPIAQPVGASDGEDSITPAAYFKLVATPDALSAFIFQSDLQQHMSFCDQASTLEAVESATGLDLFPQRESSFTATLDEELNCNRYGIRAD